MRRRPEEDDEEEQHALEADARPSDRRPADHGREGAGGAADHDVLRRRALQPHRVDDGIEEDGEGEQRRGTATFTSEAEHHHRADRRASVPKASASPRVTRPAGTGRLRGCGVISASISASHHMFSAPEAPAPMAMHSRAVKAITGCTLARRAHDADQRGEHDQRHHPRLQQRDIVGDGGQRGRSASAAVPASEDICAGSACVPVSSYSREATSLIMRSGAAAPLQEGLEAALLICDRRGEAAPVDASADYRLT